MQVPFAKKSLVSLKVVINVFSDVKQSLVMRSEYDPWPWLTRNSFLITFLKWVHHLYIIFIILFLSPALSVSLSCKHEFSSFYLPISDSLPYLFTLCYLLFSLFPMLHCIGGLNGSKSSEYLCRDSRTSEPILHIRVLGKSRKLRNQHLNIRTLSSASPLSSPCTLRC